MTDEELYDRIQRKKAARMDLRPKPSRRPEVAKLLDIITEKPMGYYTPEMVGMINSITDKMLGDEAWEPTDRQLFYLRDIKDKLL